MPVHVPEIKPAGLCARASPPPPLIGMNHLHPTRGSAEAGSAKAMAGPTASAFRIQISEKRKALSHAASQPSPFMAWADTGTCVPPSLYRRAPAAGGRRPATLQLFIRAQGDMPRHR
jgi:hypothetical protein